MFENGSGQNQQVSRDKIFGYTVSWLELLMPRDWYIRKVAVEQLSV